MHQPLVKLYAISSIAKPSHLKNFTTMAVSLFDLTVPTYLQTVIAVRGFLEAAAEHCAKTGTDPDDFVGARLFSDMAPFHFQIECVANHSAPALEAMKTGVFSAPDLVGHVPFADLQARLADTEAALRAFTRDEVNTWTGKELDLKIGPRQLAFTSETFFVVCPAKLLLPRRHCLRYFTCTRCTDWET